MGTPGKRLLDSDCLELVQTQLQRREIGFLLGRVFCNANQCVQGGMRLSLQRAPASIVAQTGDGALRADAFQDIDPEAVLLGYQRM